MNVMTDAIPVLDTQRLTLRAPKKADLPTLVAFFATQRSHMVGGPVDAMGAFTKLTARIGHWAIKGYGMWHIDDRKTGDFLGWVGVRIGNTNWCISCTACPPKCCAARHSSWLASGACSTIRGIGAP